MMKWRQLLLAVLIIGAVRAEDDSDVSDDTNQAAPVVELAPEPVLYKLPVVGRKEAHLFEPFASEKLSDGRVK